MRRGGWLRFVAARWFAATRASGGSAGSYLAAAGIAVGVAALIVILGVMNGFQLGYIESILEVSSFHLRFEEERSGGPDLDVARRLASVPGVRSVLPFHETQVLIASRSGRSLPLRLSVLPEDAAMRDPGMFRSLSPSSANFPPRSGLLIGVELARYLGLGLGDEVDVVAVIQSASEGVETRSCRLTIAGTFRSGYYDFDFGLGFVSEDAVAELFPREETRRYVYGIKLSDRYRDSELAVRLGAVLTEARRVGLARQGDAAHFESWREYNRAFFGALRTEKTLMILLVGLIFVVVGVNIHHAMRRTVAERMEDIALLKAVGAGSSEIRRVFVLDGLAVGGGGAFVGLVVGLLIAVNVNEVFGIVEALVNGASQLWARIAGSADTQFRVFSPEYFYLMEVPVRVLFPETLFVVAAAAASAALAAGSAAARVSALEPAEVLRYE